MPNRPTVADVRRNVVIVALIVIRRRRRRRLLRCIQNVWLRLVKHI